ncbi:MAG: hypothetical protein ACD_19C00114G0005 [uncultured bacterium]|nr:MAG: hypothetical protein ACD_19C00114G0005 [uncultured bacterium]
MEIQIKTPNITDWQVIQKLNNEVFQADKDHDEDLKLDWPFSKAVKFYKTNGFETVGVELEKEI